MSAPHDPPVQTHPKRRKRNRRRRPSYLPSSLPNPPVRWSQTHNFSPRRRRFPQRHLHPPPRDHSLPRFRSPLWPPCILSAYEKDVRPRDFSVSLPRRLSRLSFPCLFSRFFSLSVTLPAAKRRGDGGCVETRARGCGGGVINRSRGVFRQTGRGGEEGTRLVGDGEEEEMMQVG